MEMNFDKLYSILERITTEEFNDSTPNLGLQKDLGIYGDDAVDLLTELNKAYNVDIYSFPVWDYFDGEQPIITRFIGNLFKKTKRKELTIDDLKAAIQSGKLV